MIIKTLQLANAIREANIHALPEGMEKRHCVRNAYVYKGMTMENFYTYTKDFLNQDAPGYNNMKRGDAQVVEYLQKNNFTVFIVSGSERFEVRTIVEGHLNIPESQIIGSSATTVIASGQGDIKMD